MWRCRFSDRRVTERLRGDAAKEIRRKNEEDVRTLLVCQRKGRRAKERKEGNRDRDREPHREGKTLRDVERRCGRERRINWEWWEGLRGEREHATGMKIEERRQLCDDGGTRRKNACQLDNSTSTSRPWLPPSALSYLPSRSCEGKPKESAWVYRAKTEFFLFSFFLFFSRLRFHK